MTDNNLDHIHSESVNMDQPPIQGEEIVPEMEVTAEPEATPEPLAEVEATTDTQETAEPPQEASDQEQTAEQKRLARLANDVREKNRKLIEAQAEIERLKAGQPRGFDDKDLEERLAVKEFERATQAIFKTGMDSYGQGFKQAVDSMNDVCNDPDRLNGLCEGIIAAAGTTNGHLLVKHLGDNPDVLEDMVKLSPRNQGAELAKLALQLTAPKAKPVSKAPAPMKTISATTTSTSVDPNKMSMDEFVKWSRDRDKARGKYH